MTTTKDSNRRWLRTHFFGPPRSKGPQPPRLRPSRLYHNSEHTLELLEPRLLLNGDITTPGVKNALVNDLSAIQQAVTSALTNSSFTQDANTRVPLVNQPAQGSQPAGPPKLSDFLNADLTGGTNPQDFATLFQNQLVTPLQNHGSFTDNAALADFLNSLGYQNPTLKLLFPGLSDVLVKVGSISTPSDTSTSSSTTSAIPNTTNTLKTTTTVETTELDLDLTFQLDQLKSVELDLGKIAALTGFTIDTNKGEGSAVDVQGLADLHFVFGTIITQTTIAKQVYDNSNNPISDPQNGSNTTVTNDPFLKPTDSSHGLDLSGTVLRSDGKAIGDGDLNFKLRLGFLGLSAVNQGGITVNPDAHLGFTDPDNDGFIYLGSPQTKTAETPGVAESHAGSISATFGILATFDSFTSSGGSISLGGDPFSASVQPLAGEVDQSTAPTVSETGLDSLLPFASLTPDTAAGLIEAFGGTPQLDPTTHNPLADPAGGWLNNLAKASSGGNFDFLDFKIPFAGGTTLANVLNFAEAFNQKVIGFGSSGLINKDSNNQFFTNFSSAQELQTRLNSILSSRPAYDSSTQSLTFPITLDYSLADQSAPIGFNVGLNGLTGINASGTASLNNLKVSLGLTFGYDLHAPDAIKLSASLNQTGTDANGNAILVPFTPANGQLSGTAHFLLDIGQGATLHTLAVQVAPNSSNSSITDLEKDVQDAINAALTASSLTGVTISVANDQGRLTLTTGSGDQVTILRVRASDNDPASNELGFKNDPESRVASTLDQANKQFFIEPNANALEGDAKLSASNISLSANFGFLSIGTSGGTADLSGKLTLGLKDPGADGDSRIDLGELFSALSNPTELGKLLDSPSVTGSADVKLNHLQATPDIFNLNSTLGSGALIDLSSGDLKSFSVTPPAALTDFKNIDFSNVDAGISGIAAFIKSLTPNLSNLDAGLKVAGIKIEDVIHFVDALTTAVSDFNSNPASAVQQLQQHLYEALGLPSSSNAVQLQLHPGDALQITFNLTDSYSNSLPLSFDLGSGITLAGAANLAVSADAAAKLDFGISLTTPGTAYIYDDTGLNFDAKVVGQNLNFTASIGPVGLFIKGGTAILNKDGNTNTADPASLQLGLDSTASHRYDVSDAVNHLASPVLTGGADIELPIYFPTTSNFLVDFGFKIADLNNPTPVITPSNITDTLTGLLGQFDNILQALPLTVDGLDTLLGQLQKLLNSNVFDPPIPLVGDHLADAGQFLESFRENVVSQIRNALDNAPAMAAQVVTDALYSALGPAGANFIKDQNHDGQITEDDIQLQVDGSHVQWNMDLGPDNVNNHTIGVTLPTGFDLGLPGLQLKATGGVEVDMPWDLPFGFGVSLQEGFYFVAPSTPMTIGVTVKPTPGFSVGGSLAILSVKVTDNNTASNPTQFSGNFNVSINDPTPNDGKLTLSDLGSLDVDASLTAQAHVDLDLLAGFGSQGVNTAFPNVEVHHFLMDWTFSSADTKQGKQDLSGWGNEPTVQFNDITLNLGTFVSNFLQPIFQKVSDIGTPIKPVLDVLTFPIPVISQLMGQPIDLITIGQDFGLIPAGTDDIAKFTDQFIGVAQELAQMTTSSQAELPLGSFSLNSHDLVTGTASTDLIPLLSGGGHGSMSFDHALTSLGSWDSSTNSFSVQDLFGTVKSLVPDGSVGSAVQDALDFIASGVNVNNTTAGRQIVQQFKLDFPLFEHPTQVFQMLLGQGQDIDVVTALLPTLGFDFHYEQFFPIWDGLGVKLEGDIGAHVNLSFGFDLSGLLQYAKSGFRLDALHDIFYGLYVGTTLNPVGGTPSASNPLVPLADVEADIGAAAELNLGVASAGVEGMISAELDLFAHDTDKDGRFHLNEIISDLELGFDALQTAGLPAPLAALGAPLGLFDFQGTVKAKLFAYIEALFGAWKKEFNITPPITLLNFDFSIADIQSQPVLAEGALQANGQSSNNDLGPGYLRLNLGPYAANRVNGNATDGDETVTLKHVGGTVGDETIEVDGFGTSQTYAHVKDIVIDSGAGNDHITFDKSGGYILADATVLGGPGDDTIDLTGLAGHAVVHGGPGNDTIIGGGDPSNPVGELLYGDEGSDTVTGGPGNDTIIGGAGDDSLAGGGGNDIILGDDGTVANDGTVSLIAGGGNDTITGGDGNDLIYGGDGNDVILGDSGTVTGGSNPVVTLTPSAGEGNDTIYGGNGNDLVHGGGGNDSIYGEAGRDTLYGDAGNDIIFGGLDSDVVIGGLGNDLLFGDNAQITLDGSGNLTGVTLLGGNGNDILLGDDGSVDLTGAFPKVTLGPSGTGTTGGGDDTVYGGDGADLIYGDSGNDHLYGNDGDDIVFGNAGNDVIDGGTGNDALFGDNGQVTFVSGPIALFYQQLKTTDPTVAGNDSITGGQGDDTVFGGPGQDQITGDVGNDILFGDQGEVDFSYSAQTGSVLQTAKTTDYQTGDSDTVSGGAGNDILFGGDKGDTLYGDHDLQGNPVQSPATPGNDIIIGDQGEVDFTSGSVAKIYTTDTSEADGGADSIFGNEGNDILLGGVGGDTIQGDGTDILIGDEGLLRYDVTNSEVLSGLTKPASVGDGNLATLDLVQSIPVVGGIVLGGADTLSGGPGTDIEIGGVGADTMYGDDASASSGSADGADILLGDNGVIFLAGGYQGTLVLQGSAVARIQTTDTAENTGGADTLSGNAGGDILLGGVGSDQIYGDQAHPTAQSITNDGNDVILGDNGLLDFNSADTNAQDPKSLRLIQSATDGLGGPDTVTGNAGADLVMGGTGGDTIYGDDAAASAGASDGEDILLGDNGEIDLSGAGGGRLTILGSSVQKIFTTDTSETTGGADSISGNASNDIILGGVGADTLYGDSASPNASLDGNDVIVGDNGLLDFSLDGDLTTLDLISSSQDGLGGNDTLSGNAGADVVIGGTGSDSIYGDDANANAGSADGADILLGDNADISLVAKGNASGGDLKLVLGSAVATIRTTDNTHPEYGGSDTISGNAGADIIAGGVAGDVLYGDRANPTAATTANDGNDTILGDNGALEWLSTGRLSDIGSGANIAAINPALWAKYGTGVADTDLTTLDLVTTEQPTNGGRDTIYGDGGNDVIFGGTDSDTLYGDDGNGTTAAQGNNDLMFGDNGRLYPQFAQFQLANGTFASAPFPDRNFFAIDTGANQGGEGDQMWGEIGNDTMLGEQGDDRMWGGAGDDDMIGGSNVAGSFDELGAVANPAINASLVTPLSIPSIGVINDMMDGGSGNDVMAGDNAMIWRRPDALDPRFRLLTAATLYTATASTITTNVGATPQNDPTGAVGRDITLLDHSNSTAPGLYGNDVIVGGGNNDMVFGELGNDLIAGDGSIGTTADPGPNTEAIATTDTGQPNTSNTLYFNIPEAATDGDDYIEGNGGNDLIYGGLGQDDIIGGSSSLFGLTTPAMRPDGSDVIYGGAGIRTGRNDLGEATLSTDGTNTILTTPIGHAHDADFIMGDDANIYRPVALALASATGDAFLTFNYDTYTNSLPTAQQLHIIPRAMQQLDYTLGGGDYAGGGYNANGQATPTGQGADNGGADQIHGEAGDDTIFGETGSDVLFGDGQNDDIVGGYGNDWISGGTGNDGVIGDDGLISTSRNGLTEPLYGLTTPNLQQTISTPGNIQYAVINNPGDLQKSMDLVPFSYDPHWTGTDDEFPNNSNNIPFADDIIFGGLGNDSLHGGSGDDAISGAEALLDAYVPKYDANGNLTGVIDLGYAAVGLTNLNPGNVLAFNPIDSGPFPTQNRQRAGQFALYDEYNPMRIILLHADGTVDTDPLVNGQLPPGALPFLLNFNKDEGVLRPAGVTSGPQGISYPAVHDDGNDVIFGDNGNDWIVGGTGRDDMYGGWGNDLINADDDQTTDAGANDQPDTHPTYEDRAYGGAGRDVLIGNTGGDRLIDWVGEYNSYIVPFAPFGMATVSRTVQPQLPEFLYALSKADGADQTQPADVGSDPLRNGEAEGELGLVLQKDFAWHAQTGAPSDPQAGNLPGGQRDVLRSADFNNGQAQGFMADSGTWTVANGRYQVSPTVVGGDAVSVFDVDTFLPHYFEMLATVNAAKPTGGMNANGYLVFDYQGPTNFKFAGINVSTNKLEMGHRNAQGWIVDTQAAFPGSIQAGTDYNLFLAVNGSTATLTVNNKTSLSFTFPLRTDVYGMTHALNDGMVGLGAVNATAQIDNVAVQRVPLPVTMTNTVDFSSGPTGIFQSPVLGTWNTVNGRYEGTAGSTTPAIDLYALSITPSALIDLTATLKTSGGGGFVFDAYAQDDFKFVVLNAATKQVVLGHRTKNGWFTDAVYNYSSLTAGVNYGVELTLKNNSVSVAVNGATVLSYAYNALVTDGGFGLLSQSGLTSYDTVTLKTDDPQFTSS